MRQSVNVFLKKEKNKTTEEFKLWDPKTREYLNTEMIEYINERMKNRNAGKQLYRIQAIERDCLKKLRDRSAEYQLMSNARVEYVKSIRKKRRLKERYAYCLIFRFFKTKIWST